MPPTRAAIPIHKSPTEFRKGIAVSRLSFDGPPPIAAVAQAHRDDWHLFIVQEQGTTAIEIDFQVHKLPPGSLIYIHPSQVHRLLAFEQAIISSWAISTEQLQSDYLTLLEDLTPAKPLALTQEACTTICETVSLCLKLAERKHEALYQNLLKDSGNLLVALATSQYIAQTKPAGKLARPDLLVKAFRVALERDFALVKRPGEYAGKLAVSTPYLNECVKNATGYSVSQLIHQRIVLEAKRLLYYSAKSVKEIAAALGYDDYTYFIRLFTKTAGMAPLAFRTKNRD